ncbi:hypothetical protein IU448_14205 [Nocardia flavorosea]|uniref:hypothetical protein n=1 Tax=Nocardia flavorosea TaxID=53429 RepID=UPI001895B764|nr:hypothetical protein [Nocardia flavorosea]MBF6350159.1 hypothetical protein [Nocardia flavorosea]
MIFAPVLQDVAARMAGVPPGQCADPVRQAYRLRDAVALVRPDWVVTHHHPGAEADRVRAAGNETDLIDIVLAAGPPVGDYVELTRVLTALYPGRAVAASLTGPVGMAEALTRGPGEVVADVLDCGDLLAELITQYVAAGATRVVVWEPETLGLPAEAVTEAHTPLVRKLRTLGVPGVLCGGADISGTGYTAHALPGRGVGAALLAPDSFTEEGASANFEAWLREWFGRSEIGSPTAQETVLLSDGPLAAESSMRMLRAAGQRVK